MRFVSETVSVGCIFGDTLMGWMVVFRNHIIPGRGSRLQLLYPDPRVRNYLGSQIIVISLWDSLMNLFRYRLL